jgi:hypothetical protein
MTKSHRADPVRRYLKKRGVRPDLVEGGLPGLVARWQAIVDEVAGGYKLTLDDYLNDMDVRDIIAGALAVAEAKERRTIERPLALADETFLAATNPENTGDPQNPPNPANPSENWWYFRKPRRALS